MQQSIDVTVAALVERSSHYLIVEEKAAGRIVFNQPAGHLERGESLVEAVIRETREETGYTFAPQALTGIYLWHSDDAGRSFLRVTFAGSASAPDGVPALDDGIVAVHWLTRNELLNRAGRLRSPFVIRCIDDFLAGQRYPLDCLAYLHGQLSPHARSA